jgi:hypothetical protein
MEFDEKRITLSAKLVELNHESRCARQFCMKSRMPWNPDKDTTGNGRQEREASGIPAIAATRQ